MTSQDNQLKKPKKQDKVNEKDVLSEKEANEILRGDKSFYRENTDTSGNNGFMRTIDDAFQRFDAIPQEQFNEEHIHDGLDSHKVEADSIDWTSIIRSIIKLNGTQIKALSVELVDDATINLPDATSGVGVITADGEEGAIFIWTSAAVVTLIANSGNVSASSVDTDLCIYDGGTSVTIENKLGATKTIKYLIIY